MRELDRGALSHLLARPDLQAILGILDGGGEETRVVGGAVRNALIGRLITDIDLTTTATPDEVTARAERAGLKVVPTGIEHGTVTVLVEGRPFEVTTLREDVETHGRRATVRFGRDFAADARRRDFTINALTLSRDGTIHDDVGGLADLAARRVVFIGDAGERIREDYLRILRFFRFHAEYGEGPLDPQGLSAAIRERKGLAILSKERVRHEGVRLLRAPRAIEVLAAMSDAGFTQHFLGGLVDLGRLRRIIAFEEAQGRAPSAVRRLAALAVFVAEDVERLRENLRLSNAEQDRLLAYAKVLAQTRSWPAPMDKFGIRRLVGEHGIEPVVDLFAAVRGEPQPQMTEDAWGALDRYAKGLEAVPVFPLRGADLVEHGVPKGPDLGRRLGRARERWLEEGCPADEAARTRLLSLALQ